METIAELESVNLLKKDLLTSAKMLTAQEARYLVDYYYQIQEYRKAAKNQISSSDPDKGSCTVLTWAANNFKILETQMKKALDSYSDGSLVGRWSKSIYGIGPVIAAGLLAHIDITKAPTVGHIWRFAGVDPTVTWEKGHKRPWNAELKTLLWKTSDCFLKFSNAEEDVYGHVLQSRLIFERERNEQGYNTTAAEVILSKKKFDKTTDAYKAYQMGKLPPAHLLSRAKRYAVKLFISHWHHVAYWEHYGENPPKPYILNQPGHVHYLAPPNWPFVE